MAYKVGTTIVIDDTGFVPWARISGAPAAGLPPGEYTKTAAEYKVSGSGSLISTTFIGLEFQSDLTYHEIYLRTYQPATNCNCACYC